MSTRKVAAAKRRQGSKGRRRRTAPLLSSSTPTQVRGCIWDIAVEGSSDPLADQLGQPGLWRFTAPTSSGGVGTQETMAVRRFACPAFEDLSSLVGGEAWALDFDSLESETQNWAHVSSRGKLPKDWEAPSREEVKSWLPAERLTVRSGPHLSRGQLECDAKTLRLSFPELVRVPAALPEARHSWARTLCFDAQMRWQLVRFGIRDQRVRAEVDLSGVPAPIAQPLFILALEALLTSVRWALPALALIGDPSTACPLLDRGPWWTAEGEPRRRPSEPARPPATAG